MKPKSRSRRLIKWSGTIVGLAIIVLWGLSFVLLVSYTVALADYDAHAQLFRGTFLLGWGERQFWNPGWEIRLESTNPWEASYWPHVVRGTRPGGPPWVVNLKLLIVPLWMPCAVIALPSLLLFWRDLRYRPPGHCPACGYDLTGNTSGVCPECGTPITPPPAPDRARIP